MGSRRCYPWRYHCVYRPAYPRHRAGTELSMVLRSLVLSPHWPPVLLPIELVYYLATTAIFILLNLTDYSASCCSYFSSWLTFQQVSGYAVSMGPEFHIYSMKAFLYMLLFLNPGVKPALWQIMNFPIHLQPWKIKINLHPLFSFYLSAYLCYLFHVYVLSNLLYQYCVNVISPSGLFVFFFL